MFLAAFGWLIIEAVGLFSLLVVAADEETGVDSALLVQICTIVFKVLYFPLVHVETSSNVGFVMLYMVNISVWYVLLIVVYRYIRRSSRG